MSRKGQSLCFAYLRIWHRDVFSIDSTRATTLYRVFTSDKISSEPLLWSSGRRFKLKARHGCLYFIVGPSAENSALSVYHDGRIWLREGGPSEDDNSLRFQAIKKSDSSKLFDDLVRCEIRLAGLWLVYYFSKLDILSPDPDHSFLVATNALDQIWSSLARSVADGLLSPYPDVALESDFVSYFYDYVIPGNVYWMTYSSVKSIVNHLEMTIGPAHSLLHTYYAHGWLLEFVNAGMNLTLARFTQICSTCYDGLRRNGVKLPPHLFTFYTFDQLIDHRCKF